MIATLTCLLAAALVIYFSCEFFVNAVEWLGKKWGVNQTAIGSVLAAFGTALPESTVTLVATAFGASAPQKQIGIGAALGGPLVLSTVAYAVVGISLLVVPRPGIPRRLAIVVDGVRLRRNQAWFLAIFGFKIALGVLVFALKPWLGVLFLVAYAWYLRAELRSEESDDAGEIEPLKFRRRDPSPSAAWVLLQTALSLFVIFVASRVFVGQLEAFGKGLGLAPQLTALLLSPIATELPETLNAVIWVRQGKERLALANISGAMMVQATVPTSFGLFFTPWLLDRSLLISAAVTALATGLLFLLFRRREVRGSVLAHIGWLYLLFVLAVLC
jgi:cation:H+ antiporter